MLIPKGRPPLHGVELNRSINRTYARLATELQDALGGTASGPSWYAMAIYASRGAGAGMLAADRALAILRPGDEPRRSLQSAFPSVPPAEWEPLNALLDRAPLADAVAFLAAFWLAQEERPERLNFDPRVLAISAGRLARLLERPGASLEQFAHTVKSMLEDGNRRIFEDIGRGGERYLAMRPAEPRAVVRAFAENQEQAGQVFQDGLRFAAGEDPLPTDFNLLYGLDSQACLAAGFGLYEQATREPDVRIRQRLVAHASNLLAYHEQVNVAVPAFLPPEPLPGEFCRPDVMEVLTPQIDVKTRHWTWKLAQSDLADLDGSFWTPPSTEHNWAFFEERWGPILDYFGRCQADPETLWPMPNPDPAKPV